MLKLSIQARTDNLSSIIFNALLKLSEADKPDKIQDLGHHLSLIINSLMAALYLIL